MQYEYRCSACRRKINELDKIPPQLIETWTCIFCGEAGTMVFQRTITKYDAE